MIEFLVSHTAAGGGRVGLLRTSHGSVRTPAFMPVGTYGTVRGLTPAQLREAGVEILLANAYHLALRPGSKTIKKLGGLHRFMGWTGPILTDSGGYQLFSLASQVTVGERGASFCSHIDGARLDMTPERAAEIQQELGVDIAMTLDLVTAEPGNREVSKMAAERTLRWAKRTCEAVAGNGRTAFFGIMQGGLFEDLRRTNAQALAELPFAGYGVGGLSVGEEHEETMRVAALASGLLPQALPRYMMGMGTPEDLLALVGWGYDLFDCVIPTRNARNGTLFTRDGKLAIRNAVNATADEPVDRDCDCYCCRTVSRAYLHHLTNRGEILAAVLASVHNLQFYQRLMQGLREALARDRYDEFCKCFLDRYRKKKECC